MSYDIVGSSSLAEQQILFTKWKKLITEKTLWVSESNHLIITSSLNFVTYIQAEFSFVHYSAPVQWLFQNLILLHYTSRLNTVICSLYHFVLTDSLFLQLFLIFSNNLFFYLFHRFTESTQLLHQPVFSYLFSHCLNPLLLKSS